MTDKQVGIRLQVTAGGLNQIDDAGKKVTDLGTDAADAAHKIDGLDQAAAKVKPEVDTLGQGAADAGKKVDTLGQTAAATGTKLQEAGAQASVLGTKHAQAAVQADALQGQLKSVAGQLSQVAQAAQVLIGGQLLGGLIGDIGKTADAYTNLGARIELVTGKGAALDSAFQGVFDVALRTNSELEATGKLFTKIADAGKTLGLSQQDALRLTETINQAVQLSGETAEISKAAIIQLVQGLNGGVLRGQDFNSMMEQALPLAKAMADGLGVTTGELRKMAEAGSLTSAAVIGALQGQAEAVQKNFDVLPPTIGRALTNLETEWTRYIGQLDKTTGASHLAASGISELATHLDQVGAFLYSAGKAAVAYQAINLAGTFLATAAAAGRAAAAKEAETAATLANTAATGSNTAAKVANTAETEAAGAAASRFAAILSTLKLVSLVTIVTNFREIGTAIGEAAAKAMGWGKVLEDNEIRAKADAQAARDAANAKAALAQQTAAAAEKALGLDAASRKLIADFDDLVTKGDSAADAIGKVAKNLDLSNPKGIQDAVTALDVLEKKGKITGDQLKASLAAALDGKDLGVFETTAIASFDHSAQGAARLKLVLDAIADESLKRAGTSVQELQTGFSAAMNTAVNDTDALTKTLDQMGIHGEKAGRLVAAAVNKEIDAAHTEEALKLVIQRIQDMGAQGRLAGDDLALALDKAKNKADDLVKGINSIDEALRAFGLKTKAELQVQADTYAQAWAKIKDSTALSIEDQIAAFKKYKDAAVAANAGVLPSSVKLQETILQTKADAAGLGDQFVKAMGTAAAATVAVNTAVAGTAAGIAKTSAAVKDLTASLSVLAATGSLGKNADGSVAGSTHYTPPPDNSGDYEWIAALGQDNGGHWQMSQAGLARRSAQYVANRDAAKAAADNYTGNTPDGRYEITINIGGALNHVYATDKTTAEKLVADMQAAFKAAGN